MTTNPHPPVQPSAGAAMPRLLTLRDVMAATALSRSAVYALMAESARSGPRATEVDTAVHATGSMSPLCRRAREHLQSELAHDV